MALDAKPIPASLNASMHYIDTYEIVFVCVDVSMWICAYAHVCLCVCVCVCVRVHIKAKHINVCV